MNITSVVTLVLGYFGHPMEIYSTYPLDRRVDLDERITTIGCKGRSSGIHQIKISAIHSHFPALCNSDIAGGDWIVIHKRFDGSENFNRNWSDYRNGFGKLEGEFFVGLELLHRITHSEQYELYIEMEDFNGNVKTVLYDNFRIGNNETKYLLESLGAFNGTAANIMEFNRKFSTWDSNNDYRLHGNCADEYSGGWWYTYYCDKTNLNGRYYENGIFKPDSMTWNGWDVLKSVQMLIRQHSSDII